MSIANIISDGAAVVSNTIIPISTKEIYRGNTVLRVTAGTNGFNGSGSRTFIRIEDIRGDDLKSMLTSDAAGIELLLCGESELEAIVEGLRFVIETIEEQAAAIEIESQSVEKTKAPEHLLKDLRERLGQGSSINDRKSPPR